MQTAEQVNRVKEVVNEVNEIVARKVEQDNYEQGNRFINNDLKVMEERMRAKTDSYKLETDRKISEVQDYLLKYIPVELQATVSTTLASVLTRKKDLVNLASIDKERFKQLKAKIVPTTTEELQELRKIEEEADRKIKRKNTSKAIGGGLKTLQEEDEGSEGVSSKRVGAAKTRKTVV